MYTPKRDNHHACKNKYYYFVVCTYGALGTTVGRFLFTNSNDIFEKLNQYKITRLI